MKAMCAVVATCAVLAAMSSVAQADLVLVGGTPSSSFIDLGAQGFGAAPRLLTEQTSTFESGFVTPISVVHGDAISGADKSTTPTLATLGWTSGAKVGIGFNADQVGQTGITLQTLTLTIFNSAFASVGSFSLAGSIQFSAADLAQEPGNGNAVFDFVLSPAQQTVFNTLLANNPGTLYAGLSASLGCAGAPGPLCQVSNDGPDSFVGFAQPGTPTFVPEPGTLLLLGTGLVGLAAFARKKFHR